VSKPENDIYVYVHFVDIGRTKSPRANMLMIEKQDIVDMFTTATENEIEEYKNSEKKESFFPLDGWDDEQDSTYVLFRI
tara:strand:+ start:4999 stop:5235 length:237 start_codon:yes stop_codon:yes gene_type:complete